MSFLIFIFISLILSFKFPNFFSDFQLFIPFLLGFVMFGMGMTIETENLKNTFKKPKPLIIGVILQYTLMPFLAFFLARYFSLEEELVLGFIILGSCPGGTASNIIAYLMNADVTLSISLTILSTALSCIFTPILIFFYAKTLIDIDIEQLINSTFWIIVFPLIDGIIVRKIFKRKVKYFIKFLPKFAEFVVAFIIGIIFSLNLENLDKVNVNFCFVIVLHNILGFSMAYFIAKAFLLDKAKQKTLAIEVGMQNSGLGVTLSIIHFNKIVALPSAIFSLWHNISAIILINFWRDKKINIK